MHMISKLKPANFPQITSRQILYSECNVIAFTRSGITNDLIPVAIIKASRDMVMSIVFYQQWIQKMGGGGHGIYNSNWSPFVL